MTFLLFALVSITEWLGRHKTQKIPKEQLTIGRFCDINCAVTLRYSFVLYMCYVLSVTFCGAVVIKVIDQKTLVKHRCLPDKSSQIFDWKPSAEPCQTIFLSL